MRVKTSIFSIIVCVAIILTLPVVSLATTIYSYSGNQFNYNNTGGLSEWWRPYVVGRIGSSLSISFEISDNFNIADHLGENLLSVDRFSKLIMSDGITTIDFSSFSFHDRNSYAMAYIYSLDENMNPLSWTLNINLPWKQMISFKDQINAYNTYDSSATYAMNTDNGVIYYMDYFDSRGNPGTWTHTTPVPEPSSIFLFCSGVACFGLLRRRFK